MTRLYVISIGLAIATSPMVARCIGDVNDTL